LGLERGWRHDHLPELNGLRTWKVYDKLKKADIERRERMPWLTGFVGREEMMLSIDSRRSGYISARRTSRSRHQLAGSHLTWQNA